MADGTVAVTQAAVPDRQIDNAAGTNDAGTAVQRQRIEDPEMMELLRDMRNVLGRLGMVVRGNAASALPSVQVTTQDLNNSAAETLLAVNTMGTCGAITALNGLGGPGMTTGVPAHLMLNYLATVQRQYGVAVS